MNMLQQAIKCPDGTILLPRYEWHFIHHKQEDWRSYFIDGWEMCRYWYYDDNYELLFIDENDDMNKMFNNLVLVTKYWVELIRDLDEKELKLRHSSKIFPLWIEEIFEFTMWLVYRANKQYECFCDSTNWKIERTPCNIHINNNIEEAIECNRYAEKIKKVLSLYRQVDSVSTALDCFVDAVADDGYAIGMNISLSPVVDELIWESAREDVEYYLYEDMEDKYIELWSGKVYKLNTDEEFLEYMYENYSKNNALTK